MSNFSETAAAENFVAAADSRETSEEVLNATHQPDLRKFQ